MAKRHTHSFDAVVVGAGVTGLAYVDTLARYTNVKRILLVERRGAPALVNSNKANNGHTLHWFDTESNYSLETARRLRPGADLLAGYMERHAPDIFVKLHKLLLGVGEREVSLVSRRYGEFKPHYPELQLLDPDQLAEVEPNVMRGRDRRQAVTAMYNANGYAVDYQKLAETFLATAKTGEAEIEVRFNTEVRAIMPRITHEGGFVLALDGEEIHANTVVVAAGSSSLAHAHQFGLARDYALLPVSSSFYKGRDLVLGKVYCWQHPKLPVARLHADPSVYDPRETRLGPTVSFTLESERHNMASIRETLGSDALSADTLAAAGIVLSDPDVLAQFTRGTLYDMPFVGKKAFTHDVRHMLPSVAESDLTLIKGAGGIRGMLIDKRRRTLARGHDRFDGQGISFVLAPPAGASYCLGNAVNMARDFAAFFGPEYRFDEDRLRADYATARTPHILASFKGEVQ